MTGLLMAEWLVDGAGGWPIIPGPFFRSGLWVQVNHPLWEWNLDALFLQGFQDGQIDVRLQIPLPALGVFDPVAHGELQTHPRPNWRQKGHSKGRGRLSTRSCALASLPIKSRRSPSPHGAVVCDREQGSLWDSLGSIRVKFSTRLRDQKLVGHDRLSAIQGARITV